MIDRRSSGAVSLHILLLAAEAALLWLALAAAVPFVRSFSFTTLLPLAAYPSGIALGIVIAMGAPWRSEAILIGAGWTDAMRLAFRQTFAVACAVFALAVGLKDPGISRAFLAVYLALVGILFVVLNRFQPSWLVSMLFAGGARQPTLILGDAGLFPDLERWLSIREKFGLMPVGLVAYHGMTPKIPRLPTVGDFSDLKSAIVTSGARQVLVLNLPRSSEDAELLANVCAACGCRLLIHSNLTFQLSYPLRMLVQDGYSFLTFQDEPLEDPVNRGLKRLMDVAFALPVVLFLLPPLAALVWAVQRRQSPGSVLFLQPRSGRAGKVFHIVKFRTMHFSAEGEDRQATRGDIRIYPFARFLRRTSLDELPQFLNVLKGEMSVVGPRPHFVRHDDLFAGEVNEYRVRFLVKPGITGLAQSRGLRGEVSTSESIQQRIRLDLLYIHNWSPWLDIAIIARTLREVVAPSSAAQ